MSQFFVNVSDSNIPVDVPTSFVTDSGTVIPAAHIVNINGGSGIVVSANPNLSNNMVITVQNSVTNTTVTSDGLGQTRTLISFDASVDGSYTVEVRVSAFEPLTKFGAGFSLYALVVTSGGVPAVETDTDKIAHIMPGLKPPTAISSVDTNITISGSNVIIQVFGITGKTIDWGGFSVYIYRG